jgi:hypothetical protein
VAAQVRYDKLEASWRYPEYEFPISARAGEAVQQEQRLPLPADLIIELHPVNGFYPA